MEDGLAGGSSGPIEIERVAGLNGVGFRLPRRVYGVPGGTVVFMVLFGAVFCSIGTLILRSAFGGGSWAWWNIVDVGGGVLCLGVGVVVVLFACLLVVPSHAVIELERDELVAHDWIGPIRITRRRRGVIDAIELIHPEHEVERAGQKKEVKDDQLRLVVMLSDGRSLRLAHFYHDPVLRVLAGVLSEAISAASRRTIEVREERPDDPMNPERVPARPIGSGIAVDKGDGGLWIETPRRGFTGGLVGVLIFGLVFAGIPLLMLVVTLIGIASGTPPASGAIVLVIGAGTLALFALIGLVIIVSAVASTRVATRIEVDDHRMVVTVLGLGRPKARMVERGEIAAVGVRLVDSGGEDSSPRPELRVYFNRELPLGRRSAKWITLLEDRSGEEMVWIGAVLRRFLRVPAEDR